LAVKKVYECPAALGKPHAYLNGPLDYSANAHLVRPSPAMRASGIQNSGLYVLIHEASREVANFQWDAGDFLNAATVRETESPMWRGITKHTGRMVAAFGDGHVDSIHVALVSSTNAVASLGRLGDAILGTPLWQPQLSTATGFLRRFSDGTAASGF